MDTAKLLELYKRPCFIFDESARIKIEDDEIIDLDSISLDSNEDTWLLPNSKGNACEELDKEMKTRLDSVSVDGSGDFSRISLSNWDFKEETLSESFLNLLNTTNTNFKKVEIDVVDVSPINRDDLENTIVQDKVDSLQKPITLSSDDFDTFKKPLPKSDILQEIDNSHVSPVQIVGQEKNYAELSGTAKRKTSLNKSLPLCHSTPLPMLRKRTTKIETENKAWLTSNDITKTIDTCPSVTSSASSAEDLRSTAECGTVVESVVNCDADADDLDVTLKDDVNRTFEMQDDNKSTSSSDSRRSSSTSIPRTVFQSRTYSSPSSSNRRLDLAGRTNMIYSPPQNISSPPRNIYNSPRARSVKKTLYNENKIKEPSRRAPSLNRLQAPSVNIHEEFVSVVEIKSKDNNASKMGDKKSVNGPASHIPRPSSRIPMFRTSVSCTRTASKK